MMYYIAIMLSLIGALNWGIVGFSNLLNNRFNLIEWFANSIDYPILADLIYIAVGISAIVALSAIKK